MRDAQLFSQRAGEGSGVRGIPQDGVANSCKVHADLVRAAGLEITLQNGNPALLVRGTQAVGRLGRARSTRAADGHAGPVGSRPANGGVYECLPVRRDAGHHGYIGLLHRAGGKLLLQQAVSRRRLGQEQAAGGLLVQPVRQYGGRGEGDRPLPEEVHGAMQHGRLPRCHPGARMHGQPGRLADHQAGIIFKEHAEPQVHGQNTTVRRGQVPLRHHQAVRGTNHVRGLADHHAIHGDAAGFDGLLGQCAAGAETRGMQGGIQPAGGGGGGRAHGPSVALGGRRGRGLCSAPVYATVAAMQEDFLTRAVTDAVPRDLAEQKLAGGQPLRVYFGIDPTGTRLHLGHAVALRKLRALQDAGHQVIFLIGSYTAMIGDPTGRDSMRQPLSKEEVTKNFETYQQQAGTVLDLGKVEVRYNHEWLDQLTAADTLRIASHFTVQQMLTRDMFRERMKRGEDLSPMEFLYPLLQGYDSVILDVDMEVGGNDQLFNMLCGRKLQHAYGKRDKCVLTVKLLEGTDGRKMSKSYDNCIWLTDSPQDMFGKVMRVEDRLIPQYFECCTDTPMAEIKQLELQLQLSPVDEATENTTLTSVNPRDLKMRLAREIVTLYHGADAAAQAEREFTRVFSQKELPEHMPEVTVKPGDSLIDLLLTQKLLPSKNEARRLLGQGGIHLNGERVTALDAKVGDGLTPEAWSTGAVVKVGKRKFLRIKLAY